MINLNSLRLLVVGIEPASLRVVLLQQLHRGLNTSVSLHVGKFGSLSLDFSFFCVLGCVAGLSEYVNHESAELGDVSEWL
jgi:hypothetical protein